MRKSGSASSAPSAGTASRRMSRFRVSAAIPEPTGARGRGIRCRRRAAAASGAAAAACEDRAGAASVAPCADRTLAATIAWIVET